ncbi:hypothetical protein [Nocardioides sp. AN3]
MKADAAGRVRITAPGVSDIIRIAALLKAIDPHVEWAPRYVLEVWLAESRLEADHSVSRRLLFASGALIFAAVALGLMLLIFIILLSGAE